METPSEIKQKGNPQEVTCLFAKSIHFLHEENIWSQNTFAPAPFAMENASINGDVIPKFIEAIMTPKNTCYKIIHVHISLQSDVCIKNAKTRQGPHSGI